MSGRLDGKVAVVIGAGQTPGDTIGNGRATAVLFAREGARVVAVDRRKDSATQTVDMIRGEGGDAIAIEADATDEAACEQLAGEVRESHGRIDVLHNNVGIGTDDKDFLHITEETFDRVLAVNLKSVVFPCKHIVPVMRGQGRGAITNISSIAAVASARMTAYKISKAGVNAYTQMLAIANAKYGVRANVIMPGLINTPMAIEGLSAEFGIDKDELIAMRDARVPLGGQMGTAWDIAYAALFLASDEAKFITGVALPVDGGQTARVG